jgi:hypothetical protein
VFPWPEPGGVPGILGRYFVPTGAERAKIKWFVDHFGGEEDDSWMKDMVDWPRRSWWRFIKEKGLTCPESYD